jgi:hypothetical protein
MHDPGGVSASEGATNLRDDLGRLSKRQSAAFVETLEEIFPFEQFHHDERLTFINAVVEDLHDVRAAQLGGGRRFTLETFASVFAFGQLGIDELDGDVRIQRQMIGNPNSALRTLPERSDEPIAIAQNSACLEVHQGLVE